MCLLLLPLLLAASPVCCCLWQLLLLSHNSPLVTNQRPLVADFLLFPSDPLLLYCSFFLWVCVVLVVDPSLHHFCCCFIKSNFAFISCDFRFFPSIISSRFVLCIIKKVANGKKLLQVTKFVRMWICYLLVHVVVVVPFDACNMHKFPISIKSAFELRI